METNLALLSAASGLEKTMVNGTKPGFFKESITAQISAAIFYQAGVIARLEGNKSFHRTFNKIIFDQIDKDFGAYIDAQARTKPKSLKHMYEWNSVGQQEERLFKLKKLDSDGLNIRLTYNFLLSKKAVPNTRSKRKHVFKSKAEIMEKGVPVVVSPRYAERLVFDTGLGYTVFMPKGASVTVTRPGGVAAKQSFEMAYRRFFTGNLVSESIKRSGFQRIFNMKIGKALSLPAEIKKVKYTFSPNSLSAQAESALERVFGGAA